MGAFLARLTTLNERIREERLWPFALFCFVAASLLIGLLVIPGLLSPYVRVKGPVVSASLDCIPSQVILTAKTSYAQVRSAKLVLRHDADALAFPFNLPKTMRLGTPVDLRLDAQLQSAALASAAAWGQVERRVVIEFDRLPYVDLTRLNIDTSTLGDEKCGSVEFGADELAKRIDVGEPTVFHYLKLQDELSELIRKSNELVSTILIGVLVIAVFYLVAQMWIGWRDFYLEKDEDLLKKDRERLSEVIASTTEAGVDDIIVGDFLQVEYRLSFARVLGPAVGFLLTVTSLVTGLHPSQLSSQDTFLFVSSLQIALVATCMGLVVRIMAEAALRMRRQARDRRMSLALRTLT